MAEFLANDDEVVNAHKHTMYDLMANICHDGQPGTPYRHGGGCVCPVCCVVCVGKGSYRVHVRHKVLVIAIGKSHFQCENVVFCRGQDNGLNSKTCTCRICSLR